MEKINLLLIFYFGVLFIYVTHPKPRILYNVDTD